MNYGEVESRFKEGSIKEVFVLRCYRNPALNRGDRSNRDIGLKYLVVFIPSVPNPTSYHYLLYRDRLALRREPRLFRTLFTVSKAMQEWGIREYSILDYAWCKSFEATFKEFSKSMRDRKVFIDDVEKDIRRALEWDLSRES
ncbi:hypothetical protein [Niveibacterium sp. COAC-50]|uniref:hypothetical protein n=1 Tax=Niveibacterium sp. COAC-50 TaxID=2729384 RepID=UPI00155372CD|nr:hypothetical protein [Niveibacterium sp. COAC-50]